MNFGRKEWLEGLLKFKMCLSIIELTFAHYQRIGYFQEAEDIYEGLVPYSPEINRMFKAQKLVIPPSQPKIRNTKHKVQIKSINVESTQWCQICAFITSISHKRIKISRETYHPISHKRERCWAAKIMDLGSHTINIFKFGFTKFISSDMSFRLKLKLLNKI
jgi:hypothetical protein